MNTIRLIAYLAHFCGKKYCRANQELISMQHIIRPPASSPNPQSAIINRKAPEVPLDDGRILVLEYT